MTEIVNKYMGSYIVASSSDSAVVLYPLDIATNNITVCGIVGRTGNSDDLKDPNNIPYFNVKVGFDDINIIIDDRGNVVEPYPDTTISITHRGYHEGYYVKQVNITDNDKQLIKAAIVYYMKYVVNCK